MRLTKETENAIETLAYLARKPRGTILEAGALAEAVGVPRPFMSKILQRLSKAAIVNGHRGNPRGYSIARVPERLSVREIVEAIEGDDIFGRCIFWSEECSETNSCPLHGVWKRVRPNVRTMLGELTIDRVRPRTDR